MQSYAVNATAVALFSILTNGTHLDCHWVNMFVCLANELMLNSRLARNKSPCLSSCLCLIVMSPWNSITLSVMYKYRFKTQLDSFLNVIIVLLHCCQLIGICSLYSVWYFCYCVKYQHLCFSWCVVLIWYETDFMVYQITLCSVLVLICWICIVVTVCQVYSYCVKDIWMRLHPDFAYNLSCISDAG